MTIAIDGTWEYTLGALGAGDGTYDIYAYSENPVGGKSTPTGIYEITLDMTAPDKPTAPVLSDNIGADTGVISADGMTDGASLGMTGAVPVTEAGGTVTIFIDGGEAGTAAV